MARKVFLANADNIVEEYLSGASEKVLAERNSVSTGTIKKILLSRQVQRRGPREATVLRNSQLPVGHRDRTKVALPGKIVSDYLAGASEKAIAAREGVSRSVIRKILLRNGVSVRNCSAAQFVRVAHLTVEERRRMAARAHASTIGRKVSFESLCRRARTNQTKLSHVSDFENRFADMLRKRGLTFQMQTAVGPYNCDFTSGSVAVEIFGGNGHFTGRHHKRSEKRFNYLINAGFHVLIVVITRARPLTTAAADYIVAFANGASSDPSTPREYRVIGGGAQEMASGCANDGKFAAVLPLTHTRDRATGRYKSVPR